MYVTRLSDYLQAERPDETEPASFYIPGMTSWREARMKNHPNKREPDEELAAEQPLDTTDTSDVDELAVAEIAAALKALEE